MKFTYSKIKAALAIIVGLAFLGLWSWYVVNMMTNASQKTGSSTAASALTLVNKVRYLCNGGRSIDASFYRGTPPPVKPGEPPVPAGRVDVSLSDGRYYSLPQTISADGIRYANADESFVFWGKGNGALVLEHNVQKSYTGCIIAAPDPGGLSQAYADGQSGFSIRYPAGWSVNSSYIYQALGPGNDIHGVKFTIPASMATGTNLSPYDTGLSVEEIPQVSSCRANLFLDNAPAAHAVTDSGTEYSVTSSTDAAAGNRYEETVWAIPGTNPCVAVRYFIHYGVIENYPPGAVNEFDKMALWKQFDAMRKTLILVPQPIPQ